MKLSNENENGLKTPFPKKILKFLGINPDNDYCCIGCKKPMSTKIKRCPSCEVWNDCCSIDPRLLGKKDDE
ncbi:MAG: hypothetical protein V3V78_03640 [Candidatus Woesearchaeota archaeon]